ncbi:hypothetical protein CEXT_744321 [Caerostris extrusa]|uniref:Uncharacterized protein n=1 Tax=Caerostris extrusa TaxID=172846 RepID=A0AAV4Y6K3_CAEEX|nr:hypothetical protein CEXT_744321 [Caerostris extrusa]
MDSPEFNALKSSNTSIKLKQKLLSTFHQAVNDGGHDGDDVHDDGRDVHGDHDDGRDAHGGGDRDDGHDDDHGDDHDVRGDRDDGHDDHDGDAFCLYWLWSGFT